MAPPQPREEREWSVQSLLEQVELLETILLYYKDFVHRPAELRNHANQLWENGCGLRQSCPAPLVEGGDVLQRHIRLTHTLIPSHPHTLTPSLQSPLFTDPTGVTGSRFHSGQHGGSEV